MEQVFINLPVKDLEKSMNLYTQLGFSNKALFTDQQQKCMVWNENIYVMLHSQEKFKAYSKKNISNPTKTNAYFSLAVESLEELNKIVAKALKAGAIESKPMINEAFMQIRSIEDFDGHNWDILFIDLSKFKTLRK